MLLFREKFVTRICIMGDQLLQKIDPKELLKSLLQRAKKGTYSLAFELIPVDGYEQVIEVKEKKVGLHAIIAIHNTALGPALGGTRIFPYASREKALEDVLRLSKGMTYKSAVAEVGSGGGKSVIIADPKKDKTPELLMAFGEAVDAFNGLYICAEDVGCSTEDVKWIREKTKYVVGLLQEKSSGDPGYFTSWGIFRGIQSAAKKLFGTDSLEGKKVAVQGLGNVGSKLIDSLFWAGADLILSDIDSALVNRLAAKYDAKIVHPSEILKVECDILSPCAMGAILNERSIPELRCKAVAGGANNQLLKDGDADLLRARKILYAPDFVINAGGLLNVAAEIEVEGYSPKNPQRKAHRIYDTLLSIYEIAEKNHESTHAAAVALADYRIKYGIGKREVAPVFHHAV